MALRRRTRLFVVSAVSAAQMLASGASMAQQTGQTATSARISPERAGFERMIEQSFARLTALSESHEVQGSGPFSATMEVDLALPNATIYRPADLATMGTQRLGVLIWGNGGCSNDGASARKHLAEVASHAYLVIAPGKPLSGGLALPGAPKPELMRTAIQDLRGLLDWALAENSRRGSPYYDRLDLSAVAAAGHSCGAMQAILLADDPRIKTLIVHNSGVVPVLPDNPPLVMHKKRLAGVQQPTLMFLGGESDIVWKYGLSTFEAISSAPVVLASREDGHGGTFDAAHGGDIAKFAVAWLQWRLRGDRAASSVFAGPDCTLCQAPGWSVRKRGLP